MIFNGFAPLTGAGRFCVDLLAGERTAALMTSLADAPLPSKRAGVLDSWSHCYFSNTAEAEPGLAGNLQRSRRLY